jgi:uncharacterized protein YtpQ (UPF0354 family)
MLFWRKKITEVEFTDEFTKAINKSFKDIVVHRLGDLELNVVFPNDDGSVRMFLQSAYDEYVRDSKRLKEIISAHIQSLRDPQSFSGNLNDIIPVIKTLDFLNGIEAVNPGGLAKHVYEVYNEELYIFYVEDKPHSMSYLVWENFEKFGIDRSELRRLACDNLFNRYEINCNGGDNLFMLTSGGNYEASSILLDIWNKETFPVEGNIVVAIPSRDVILVTGSLNSVGLHKMYDVVADISKEGNYLVSDKLFEWNGNSFEVLKLGF